MRTLAASLLLAAPADVRAKSLSAIVVQDEGPENIASMIEGLESVVEASNLVTSLGAHAKRVFSYV